MKKLIFGLAIAAMGLGITGCNVDMFDTNWSYDTALVRWPDGSVKTIEIKKWRDYEGEQIQIIGRDGNVYLISSINAVLINHR